MNLFTFITRLIKFGSDVSFSVEFLLLSVRCCQMCFSEAGQHGEWDLDIARLCRFGWSF